MKDGKRSRSGGQRQTTAGSTQQSAAPGKVTATSRLSAQRGTVAAAAPAGASAAAGPSAGDWLRDPNMSAAHGVVSRGSSSGVKGEGSSQGAVAAYHSGAANLAESSPIAHRRGQAEGAGAGITRGGGGGGKIRRRLGVISGTTFIRDHSQSPGGGEQAQTGANVASSSPTMAQGAEGIVAFVGSWAAPSRADRTTDVDGTKVRMEDETDEQAEMIAQAVGRAKELVDTALAALDSVDANRAVIQANFQTTEEDGINQIKAKYNKIKSAFSGTIPIEVEADDTSAVAYVYRLWSDIHLCAPWFNQAADKRAGTIVHEMSHKYAGTDDNAYHHDAAYTTLDAKDAINNADSYQWLALDLVGYTG
ncbi:MAG: M35 family metallo-endopeptidase [Proteobacteria bacterium]|nr:M35 family metallo-endopeptidase [Pseudomonadota bacterium]